MYSAGKASIVHTLVSVPEVFLENRETLNHRITVYINSQYRAYTHYHMTINKLSELLFTLLIEREKALINNLQPSLSFNP